MIVVDASAILEVILRTESARVVESVLFDSRQSLHAPELLDIEVAQVLRRYEAGGEIDDKRGREALSDLRGLRIHRYPHGLLLPRIWELRNNMTAYDAAYIALSEAIGATFVTCDRRLANAPGHSVRVAVI